jgi:hypothetical protein
MYINEKIVYPTPFEQKVLTLEGTNGDPVEINLVIPSLIKPEMPFALKVIVLDKNGFAANGHGNKLIVSCEQNEALSFEVDFRSDKPMTAQIDNITLKNEGLYRFTAKLGDKIFYSNPTYCSKLNNKQIYWGDPHIHTNIGNCMPNLCRSLNFCYVGARYCAGLDWAASADHVSNGRGEYAKWREQIAVANQFSEPPEFVTLPAYEASLDGGDGGDNNIYMTDFPDMYVDECGTGNLKTLVEKLGDKLDKKDYFAVPHHTSRENKHGEISDDIYPGEEMMPAVEIHSKWGTSEYRGNPNPLQKIHDGPSYVNDFLKRGMIFGFIGGTDSHATLTTAKTVDNELPIEASHISAFPGMTAIIAESLDRESIIRAIKTRQCYAVSQDRTLILGDINGKTFGSKLRQTTGPIKIKVLIAAKTDIAKIEIIRNGEVLRTFKPESWNTDIEYTDEDDLKKIALSSKYIDDFVYYYIRATNQNGSQAWSSPSWILINKI